ncbi:hypothetical protein BAC3_00429 [uncultured bacterium]|nr:hypothetical protein BAC3_00429 [uncultured bacterium]
MLHIEGYESVDPQCPLGGPDGLKDVICKQNKKMWIAACYFPTTRQEFGGIQKKFKNDLIGVTKNKADGIVFFVNQRVTPGERSELISLAMPHSAEIYHVERIRALLDSPKGYGARLEYLRIAMTLEEQLGFWSTYKDELATRLQNQQNMMSELFFKMDAFMLRTPSFIEDLSQAL